MKRCLLPDARLERFANCGSNCVIEHSPSTNEIRLRACYCRDRLCTACGVARGRVIADALAAALPENVPVRFVTFTLRHNRLPLKDQLNRLYTCFSTLRRRQWWQQNVTGGAAFLEVKLSDRDGCWHPHLHCLVVGRYMPHVEIVREWYAVTGDSTIVDIRILADAKETSSYVAKYAAKPASGVLFTKPDQLCEFIFALKGRRLCFTFGSFRGIDLDAVEEGGPTDWRKLGTLTELLADVDAGDPEAIDLWESLCRRKVLRESGSDPPLPQLFE